MRSRICASACSVLRPPRRPDLQACAGQWGRQERMRRVVVTGMGIVSSIGNNTQEVIASLHAGKSGITRAERHSRAWLSLAGPGSADAPRRRSRRSPGDALPRRRHGLEPCRDGSGDPRQRPCARRGLQRADRPHHGFGRPLDPRHRRGRRHRPRQGPQAGRPVRGAEVDVLDRVGDPVDLVQDQGRQLFDLLRLRDLQPLHRRGL